LQGSDAAEALIQAINSANIDDTYTKLQFTIENPLISIVPIPDKHVGDKFNIKGTTNLAVDDEILVEVYSSSFKPTQKTQSGEFSGVTGTVKVARGESGMNVFEFAVDTASFKPDEYMIKAQAVIQQATGTALFLVIEGTSPTLVPTPAPTGVSTPAPTAVPTPEPTAIIITETPTPAPTPTKTPGFGAVLALAGLISVGFIVSRRQ
jgi:PGF-CTERM protein